MHDRPLNPAQESRSSHAPSRFVAVAACTIGAILLTAPGCDSAPKQTETKTPNVARSTPPPTYASVATRYNARVNKLDRVRSTAGLIITRPDDSGGTTSDQVEGNLQFQRPRNLNLRIDKVGQTVFVLGSNDDRYWWFDLSDENRAKVGTHEKATRLSVEKFGVPVQPADLAELMGVLPLDPTADAKTNWSSDGRHVVAQVATPRGARWMWLDPTTLEPARIDLINRFGERSVTAELSRYAVVPVTGDALAKPRMATLFNIDLPSQRTTIKLTLSEPTNPAAGMKPRAFEFAALTEAYGIERIEDLDTPAPPAVRSLTTPATNPPQAQPQPTKQLQPQSQPQSTPKQTPPVPTSTPKVEPTNPAPVKPATPPASQNPKPIPKADPQSPTNPSTKPQPKPDPKADPKADPATAPRPETPR